MLDKKFNFGQNFGHAVATKNALFFFWTTFLDMFRTYQYHHKCIKPLPDSAMKVCSICVECDMALFFPTNSRPYRLHM